MPYDFPKEEKEILKFWEEKRIFEKLREKNKGKKKWSFLDGPITANNPMGVHHAWGRTYKDLFQRFKAMEGYDQRFQNGFDCQGLWVEVEVEKELGFKCKKDIEEYGIDKFVEKCKERVKKYSQIQTQQSIRLGQWMDWKNSYYTMSDENNYMIWYFLKKCYERGLLYKGRDAVPWCPRCGTAISQHEILTEEYKLVTHTAIYFKLPILDKGWEGIKFLVWTTTPWTIPANVALMVHPDFEYGIFEGNGEKLILLKNLAAKVLPLNFHLIKVIKGENLRGLRYQGIFDDLERVKEAKEKNPVTFHTIVLDKELVSAEEGTGIVHIAPGAGEEDFKIGKRENLPVIEVIDESAVYLGGMAEFSGQNAKENPQVIIDYIKNLDSGRFFFKTEEYQHRYPTCWRCKKELVWRVVDEWYISMDGPKIKREGIEDSKTLREELIEIAKQIRWIPSFGLAREIDWLKNMHDWLISKKRYWGLALPIFECECGSFEVIGSFEELKERAVEGWEEFEGHSPHRPWIDKIKIECSQCKRKINRIPDVGNPWLDAGIVPFSTFIDPQTKKLSYMTDKKYWKEWFPADLVCESFPGQFKNWFYAIIVMSTILEKSPPVKNIFGYASVRDEKGEEMHKSKGNAIWFDEAVEKVGADSMRWLYARQNPVDNLLFGYTKIEEIKRKLLILYNSFVFFNTYAEIESLDETSTNLVADHILDRWIISKLNNLIKKTKEAFNDYNPSVAVLEIEDFFINDLSLWYIRRSRERFKNEGEDKKRASKVLYYILSNLLRIIAPIVPFFAEKLYQELKKDKNNQKESIHLYDFPNFDQEKIDKDLEKKMEEVRDIVSKVLAKRAELKIKIRQPLSLLKIKSERLKEEKELLNLIKEEVNVKEVEFDKNLKEELELDTKITPQLKKEALERELVRQFNFLRKEKGLTPNVFIACCASTLSISDPQNFTQKVRALNYQQIENINELKEGFEWKEIEIDGRKEIIAIKIK